MCWPGTRCGRMHGPWARPSAWGLESACAGGPHACSAARNYIEVHLGGPEVVLVLYVDLRQICTSHIVQHTNWACSGKLQGRVVAGCGRLRGHAHPTLFSCGARGSRQARNPTTQREAPYVPQQTGYAKQRPPCWSPLRRTLVNAHGPSHGLRACVAGRFEVERSQQRSTPPRVKSRTFSYSVFSLSMNSCTGTSSTAAAMLGAAVAAARAGPLSWRGWAAAGRGRAAAAHRRRTWKRACRALTQRIIRYKGAGSGCW